MKKLMLTVAIVTILACPVSAGVIIDPPAPCDPTIQTCSTPPQCQQNAFCTGEGGTNSSENDDPLAGMIVDGLVWLLTL